MKLPEQAEAKARRFRPCRPFCDGGDQGQPTVEGTTSANSIPTTIAESTNACPRHIRLSRIDAKRVVRDFAEGLTLSRTLICSTNHTPFGRNNEDALR